jgi:hypothetical protein
LLCCLEVCRVLFNWANCLFVHGFRISFFLKFPLVNSHCLWAPQVEGTGGCSNFTAGGPKKAGWPQDAAPTRSAFTITRGGSVL